MQQPGLYLEFRHYEKRVITTHYRYDPLTRRIARSTGATPSAANTYQFAFSGSSPVHEWVGDLSSTSYHQQRTGSGVGGLLQTQEADGTSTHPRHNLRGDITAQFSATGTLLWHGSYASNGMLNHQYETRDGKYGANGKYEEPTGLLNEGFRYRDRQTNTFITRDPLGFIDGPNDYNYVRHNPWSAWDPNGLATVIVNNTGDIGYVSPSQNIGDNSIAAHSYQIHSSLLPGSPPNPFASNDTKDAHYSHVPSFDDNELSSRYDKIEQRVEEILSEASGTLNTWRQRHNSNWWEKLFNPTEPPNTSYYLDRYHSQLNSLFDSAQLPYTGKSGIVRNYVTQRLYNLKDNEDSDPDGSAARIKEIAQGTADIPLHLATAIVTGASGMDIATGSSFGWNGFGNGGGFHMGELSNGERILAGSMLFFPIGRNSSIVDEVVSAGSRGKSFAGTALKPWGAKSAPGRILLGEDMERVRAAARHYGAETFEGTGMEANRAWVQIKRTQGYEVYDIGPAFERRAKRFEQGIRPDSPFYNMERMEMKGYENYFKFFERSGKYKGGAPRIDY